MCFYQAPLFLGHPDAWATTICALPLAASATGWRRLLSSLVGLTVGFLAAHFFIVLLDQEFPASRFYWLKDQAVIAPSVVAPLAFLMVFIYAISRSVGGLWRADYLRASWYVLLTLGLLGAVAYLIADARALDWPANKLLLFNANAGQQPLTPEEITPANCVFPPFGEGATGYSMLAVLVVFEMLVAIGIADAFNRILAPSPAR